MPFTPSASFNAFSFSVVKQSMMQADELPLADAIDDQRWQQVFEEHGVQFGADEDTIYTPAITLWALLSQVFFSLEQRSCKVSAR